jgi:ethanolamine utilization protein EutN
MQLGRIVGNATATIKHESLMGWPLLLTQFLDAADEPDGDPQLVIDNLGAGRGDKVIVTSDGKTIRELVGSNNCPIRWAVIGIQDT